jgi:hypothetical protein
LRSKNGAKLIWGAGAPIISLANYWRFVIINVIERGILILVLVVQDRWVSGEASQLALSFQWQDNEILGRVDMPDIKPVLLLLFVSVVLLALVFVTKNQPDMYIGLASAAIGILALTAFIKIVVR